MAVASVLNALRGWEGPDVFQRAQQTANLVNAIQQAKQQQQMNALKLQYMPQEEQMKQAMQQQQLNLLRGQVGMQPLEQQYKQQQMNLLKQQLMNLQNPQFKPASMMGKLQSDRDALAAQFGEDSPQVKNLDAAIQKAGTVTGNLIMFDEAGRPIIGQGMAPDQMQNISAIRQKLSTGSLSDLQKKLAGLQQIISLEEPLKETAKPMSQFHLESGLPSTPFTPEGQKSSTLQAHHNQGMLFGDALARFMGSRAAEIIKSGQEMVTRRSGMSESDYNKMIKQTYKTLRTMDNELKDTLASGLNLTPSQIKSSNTDELLQKRLEKGGLSPEDITKINSMLENQKKKLQQDMSDGIIDSKSALNEKIKLDKPLSELSDEELHRL